jgi:hypothetical protein
MNFFYLLKVCPDTYIYNRTQIRIRITIKTESWIRIRIGIETLPTRNSMYYICPDQYRFAGSESETSIVDLDPDPTYCT